MTGNPADDGAPELQDPMTALAAAATQLHEIFVAYVNAGFSEPQSLHLVSQIILGSMGGGRS